MRLLAGILALVVTATALAQERPVILMYWDPNFATWQEEAKDIELAIWADGRIVWRDKLRAVVKVGKEWHWNTSDYYEGKIDPAEVKKVVAQLRRTGAFDLRDWYLYPPDSSVTRVMVRDGRQKIQLSSQGEPAPTVHSGRDPKAYPKQYKAWQIMRGLAKKIAPSKRQKIKAPNVDRWVK